MGCQVTWHQNSSSYWLQMLCLKPWLLVLRILKVASLYIFDRHSHCFTFKIYCAGHTKPGEVVDFFILVSLKSPCSCQKAVLITLSVFVSQYFFTPIIILFHQYSCKKNSMFLKFDPFRVWCSIFYSELVYYILFKIVVQHFCFVKGSG